MRRTVLVAALAAVGGFCLASVAAFAALRLDIWRSSGEKFQLGYVVGYLDAATLAQRKDIRLNVPVGGGKNFDRWVREVNAFYNEPANANRPVPDAMYDVGTRIRTEWMQSLSKRALATPEPSPSSQP